MITAYYIFWAFGADSGVSKKFLTFLKGHPNQSAKQFHKTDYIYYKFHPCFYKTEQKSFGPVNEYTVKV